ncbi:hypothetical protein GC102_13425 [Paenibacillus sp. LMG 31460]|uniref:Copper amine oxidase N-terminal domain-containing protein n=1 Tax=Paenibacillus germinis TaxID=2654979 RepID=A0ABX1Z344_9BACL|nr:hypothetical protein [Paenibacillus germinis]NOU86769.1 hypothetical protein [Paenibacillus germinis]
MGKKKKAFSKKEKIIGAIASTAILAVPFMVAPAQQGYATSSVPPTATPVDKIQTIVIPQNGTKYIDLLALYDTNDIEIIQNENEMAIAKGSYSAGLNGIYEVKADAVRIGKATFMVTGRKYEPGSESEYTDFSDTFEVIVVPNTGKADEYRFDISNVFNVMKQSPDQYQSQDQVKSLLRNVSPKSVIVDSPIEYEVENTPPFPIETTDRIQGFVGEEIPDYMISQAIDNYFEDTDIRYEGEDQETDELDVIVIDKNNENIQYVEEYSDSIPPYPYGYHLLPLKSGDFDLDVLVIDHHGGMTRGKIPFHIENPETIYLDSESTMKVDLRDYFPDGQNVVFNEESESGRVTISGSEATFLPDEVVHTHVIFADYGNEVREYRTFRVVPKDRLHNMNLISGSELNLNLPTLLFPNPNPNVTFSVYQNYESVTGLTYGIDYAQKLSFNASAGTEENSTINVTVTAKDLTNHITIKDNLEIKVVPYVTENDSETVGFISTKLFGYGVNKNEVAVTEPFSIYGMFGSYSTVTAPAESGTGTTVVTLNHRDEIIYKIPFTYPIY